MSKAAFLPMPDGVRLCTFTKEKLYDLWLKIREYDQLFSDDIRYDESWFLNRMVNDTTITLETEGGILILTDLQENLMATAHVIFFDHQLSNRTDLLKACIEWSFLQFGLQRLEALIPEFCRTLQRFMEKRLGFVYEGRMRKRMLYKGQLCDVKVYSIIKEDL